MDEKSGTLYLVATPLGNLEDMSERALRTLREVDLIAAEDTRHTLKLLNHFQIKKRMVSYFQHNEKERAAAIIPRLAAGENVALVSDAGTPGISDPGSLLVAEAVLHGIPVMPIPGPSAAILAVAASGFNTASFRFEGFLPRKVKERNAILRELADYGGTIVLYEAPHRLLSTLKVLLEQLGDRRIVLARELTKIHEEFIRGSLREIIPRMEEQKPRGEFTLVIDGFLRIEEKMQNSTNVDANDSENLQNMSLRDELRAIAEKTGKSTKEVYRMYLAEKNDKK